MKDVGALLREYAQLDRRNSAAGLSPVELMRFTTLKRELVRHFSPGVTDQQADRRQSLRVPMHMRVSFSSEKDLQDCLMTNLSRSGVFNRTPHLFEIGTSLTLGIHIEATGEVIEAPATVVSHNTGPGFERGQLGMGMRFLDLPPEAEKHIADLYEKALHEQARRSEETVRRR